MPWRRKRQPVPVFLPGESHDQVRYQVTGEDRRAAEEEKNQVTWQQRHSSPGEPQWWELVIHIHRLFLPRANIDMGMFIYLSKVVSIVSERRKRYKANVLCGAGSFLLTEEAEGLCLISQGTKEAQTMKTSCSFFPRSRCVWWAARGSSQFCLGAIQIKTIKLLG